MTTQTTIEKPFEKPLLLGFHIEVERISTDHEARWLCWYGLDGDGKQVKLNINDERDPEFAALSLEALANELRHFSQARRRKAMKNGRGKRTDEPSASRPARTHSR